MDFGTLLHVAQKKVVETTQKDVKYYTTKFGPPKKEERNKQLSANVQRFLARKEAEEKQKAEEARIKKLQLLELRAQDGKSKKRVASMLQRTKSANKSVIEDAVDNRNTAVTMAGPSQPDEDDYGYESQESAAIYAKMMERYSAMPEEEKFPGTKKRPVSTNLLSTKERVKAALLREEEEANMPHKRKRRSKHDDSDPGGGSRSEPMTYNSAEYDKKEEEPQEKPKPKKLPPPPPLNFNDLLKIAEKKQFEPIIIEPKKVKDDEPLLTKKQKREAEKEKAWKESREARLRAALTAPQKSKPITSSGQDKSLMPPPNKIPKLNSDRKGPPPPSSNGMKIPKNGEIRSSSKQPPNQMKSDPNRIPKKVSSENRLPLSQNKIPAKVPSSNAKPEKRPESRERHYLPGDLRAKQQQTESKAKQYLPGDLRANQQQVQGEPKQRQYLPGDLRAKQQQQSDSKPKQYLPGDTRANQQQSQGEQKQRQYLPGDLRAKQQQSQLKQSKVPEQTNNRMSQQQQSKPRMNETPTASSNLKPKQFPPSDLRPPLSKQNPQGLKPKQFPPADLKPKQFPPADLKPRQFPPPDVRGRFPPKDVKRKPKRPIIEDEDSEYDSELDDFIDDGPQGDEEDYSKHIREIFGYDKSKYRYVDDDDDSAMESKFSTIMKEEYLSTKIGIMEDLEDIRKEAEEKKRKAIMKKKMKR